MVDDPPLTPSHRSSRDISSALHVFSDSDSPSPSPRMRSSDVFDSSFAASNTPGSPALHRSRRTSDLSMLSTDLSGYRYTCVTYTKELLNLQRRLTKPFFFYQPRLITVSRPVVAYRRRKHAGCLCCYAEFILGWYVSFLYLSIRKLAHSIMFHLSLDMMLEAEEEEEEHHR